MNLLSDEMLERSAVVANCRMNRERNLDGSNGYSKEVGFSPLDFLTERCASSGHATWLDLCCGTGNALIEAARLVRADSGLKVEILGVDLVGMFHHPDSGLNFLQLVQASLSHWRPDRAYDLITCVHGLHYIGDKLGLIARAVSWLAEDGMFVANLDLNNLRLADGRSAGRRIVAELGRCGVGYDRRKRLLRCRGRKPLALPYRYLGSDNEAGPNYTGQPAVDSYYAPIGTGGAGSVGPA